MLEADLHGRVARAFKPLTHLGNLRRAPRAVGALDDDEFATRFLEVHAGNAISVKAALGPWRQQDDILFRAHGRPVRNSWQSIDRARNGSGRGVRPRSGAPYSAASRSVDWRPS